MAKKVSRNKIEAAVGALNKVRKNWLRRPGVTAVDVGFKIKEGKITDNLALRLHVQRKLPPESLNKHEMVTAETKPESLNGFDVDVIEAEYGPSQVVEAEAVNRRGRVNPLVGGVSVGNPRITAGTLGAIVWDKGDGQACILSNWHVLCGSSSCRAGEPIWQPGRADGGSSRDTVGELKRFILDSGADAAIARLTGQRNSSRDILGLNPIQGIAAPALGMNVTKSGRSTGVTEGLIDGISLSTSINYGGGTIQTFHNQIHIVPRPPWPNVDYELSIGGDSGSVWIDDASGKAVGLHFAGETDPSPAAENAIANRMVDVAEKLNISFAPVFQTPDPDEDNLRDVLRRILCSFLPFLCSRHGGSESALPPASSQSEAGGSCPHCGQGAQESSAPAPPVEEVIEQILAEWRRNR